MACGGATDSQGFKGEGYFPRCPECGGYHRDLTPAFRGLVSEASAAIIPSSRKLHRKFRIDAPGSRWRCDPESGLFSITVPGRGRCHAAYYPLGNWAERSGQFTWAWSLPEEDRSGNARVAEHARSVGKHYWLPNLTAPSLYVGETEAWHLSLVAAYLSDLPVVTTLPSETGKMFLTLEAPAWEH